MKDISEIPYAPDLRNSIHALPVAEVYLALVSEPNGLSLVYPSEGQSFGDRQSIYVFCPIAVADRVIWSIIVIVTGLSSRQDSSDC